MGLAAVSLTTAQYNQFVDKQRHGSPQRTLRENGSCQKSKKRRCRCETRVLLVCKRLVCSRNDALLPSAPS